MARWVLLTGINSFTKYVLLRKRSLNNYGGFSFISIFLASVFQKHQFQTCTELFNCHCSSRILQLKTNSIIGRTVIINCRLTYTRIVFVDARLCKCHPYRNSIRWVQSFVPTGLKEIWISYIPVGTNDYTLRIGRKPNKTCARALGARILEIYIYLMLKSEFHFDCVN